MNPVASDLMISVLHAESQRELSRRAAEMAANRATHSLISLVGAGFRTVIRVLHQAVDPRGFALGEALKAAPTSSPEQASVRVATITPIPTRTTGRDVPRAA